MTKTEKTIINFAEIVLRITKLEEQVARQEIQLSELRKSLKDMQIDIAWLQEQNEN